MAAKACVDRAIFASVRSVNNPKLTSEYNTRVGAAQPISLACALMDRDRRRIGHGADATHCVRCGAT